MPSTANARTASARGNRAATGRRRYRNGARFFPACATTIAVDSTADTPLQGEAGVTGETVSSVAAGPPRWLLPLLWACLALGLLAALYSAARRVAADSAYRDIMLLVDWHDLNSLPETAAGASLTAQVQYRIETNWDYAYVVISTDGGTSWTHVETNHSTSTDPNGQNFGHGITGNTGGQWVSLTADLSAYTGNVLIGFRYWTDVAAIEPGFMVDAIAISGQPVDGAEAPAGWAFTGGFRVTGGQETTPIAMTMEPTEGCRTATRTSARAKLGTTWNISVKRISAPSIRPPP